MAYGVDGCWDYIGPNLAGENVTGKTQQSYGIGASTGTLLIEVDDPNQVANLQSVVTRFGHLIPDNVFVSAWNNTGGKYPESGYSSGDEVLTATCSFLEPGPITVIVDAYTGMKGVGFPVGSKISQSINVDDPLHVTFGVMTYTCSGSGNTGNAGAAGTSSSLGSAPASTSRTAPAAPTVRTFPTGGGSILLLHSDADPPPADTAITPQPSDFLTSGTTGATANPLTFSGVTNNSLNTIYYFLMDAAQNISFHGQISFYNDQTPPVVIPDFPTPVAPYTGIWLGPEKLHLDGSIEANDSPT